MNIFLRYGIVMLLTLQSATAQEPAASLTALYDKVPLIIESRLHIDRFTNNIPIYLLSGHLRIALAPRKTNITIGETALLNKPLPTDQINKLEYRVITNASSSSWQTLQTRFQQKLNTESPVSLVDTTLAYNDTIKLEFRKIQTRQMVQQNTFIRIVKKPQLIAWCTEPPTDTLDLNLRPNVLRVIKKRWQGFDTLLTDKFVIAPGKTLLLQCKYDSLNKDSALMYRIRSIHDRKKAPWQLTGHLIALRKLSPDNEYFLDYKYQEAGCFNTQQIIVSPYWYRTTKGILLMSSVAMLLLIGGLYSYYRLKIGRERLQKQLIRTQLNVIKTQLNPHFIYNAISSIEGLITNRENERANEYLNTFSGLMRRILGNSETDLISLSQELEELEEYIRLEQLRFEFRYHFQIDVLLHLDNICVPPGLLQPSVENAVKHGLSLKGASGELYIICKRNKNDLLITISDNGDSNPKTPLTMTGYGTKLTEQRIEHLQQLHKGEKILYQAQQTIEGYTVEFVFKNWIEDYDKSHYC